MATRGVAFALAAGLIITAALAVGPSAVASCVTDHPAPSPYAFVGTVIDTRSEDRIATVITDDNHRVTVRGAEAVGWFSGVSSVDRRYALGGRYQFHPLNASDPYRDNACSATHKLAGPALQPSAPGSRFRYAPLIIPVLALFGVIVLLSRRRVRRATPMSRFR